MLCQCCGQHTATTHVKRTVNGKTEEYHLCAACAVTQGFNTVLGGLDLFGGIFGEAAPRAVTDTKRCEGCGKSFREIAAAGRAGCPTCYTTFYDRLLPSIQRIHGKTGHVGKVPCAAGEQVQRARELEDLRRRLQEAITAQEYEQCAALRDQIRELEGGTGHE